MFDLRYFCQFVCAALFLAGFVMRLKYSIEGEPATEPKGFAGVLACLVIYAGFVWLYGNAGMFDRLLGR